jgi:hypothetical protein
MNRDAVRNEVFERDGGCVAAKVDPAHKCFGALTLEHVPERGKNALGKKAPTDAQHCIALCYGANSGGLQPWAELHREAERAYLERLYGVTA